MWRLLSNSNIVWCFGEEYFRLKIHFHKNVHSAYVYSFRRITCVFRARLINTKVIWDCEKINNKNWPCYLILVISNRLSFKLLIFYRIKFKYSSPKHVSWMNWMTPIHHWYWLWWFGTAILLFKNLSDIELNWLHLKKIGFGKTAFQQFLTHSPPKFPYKISKKCVFRMTGGATL